MCNIDLGQTIPTVDLCSVKPQAYPNAKLEMDFLYDIETKFQ